MIRVVKMRLRYLTVNGPALINARAGGHFICTHHFAETSVVHTDHPGSLRPDPSPRHCDLTHLKKTGIND